MVLYLFLCFLFPLFGVQKIWFISHPRYFFIKHQSRDFRGFFLFVPIVLPAIMCRHFPVLPFVCPFMRSQPPFPAASYRSPPMSSMLEPPFPAVLLRGLYMDRLFALPSLFLRCKFDASSIICLIGRSGYQRTTEPRANFTFHLEIVSFSSSHMSSQARQSVLSS